MINCISYNKSNVGAEDAEWPAAAACKRTLKLDKFQKQGKPHPVPAVRAAGSRQLNHASPNRLTQVQATRPHYRQFRQLSTPAITRALKAKDHRFRIAYQGTACPT